jgi:hypothetical protein
VCSCCVGFCVSDVAIPFSDTMRNIAMLGDQRLSNSDICSWCQGLHEHIQATVMPEINTKINQSTYIIINLNEFAQVCLTRCRAKFICRNRALHARTLPVSCGERGIGIGSNARQAFGHPVGVRILALRVRGARPG